VDFDPNAGGAIAMHGDEDREAGARCGVVAAVALVVAVAVFAGGWLLAAWMF
jgi:hypothetical protein